MGVPEWHQITETWGTNPSPIQCGSPTHRLPMCSPFPRGHMVSRRFSQMAQGEQPGAEMVDMLLMLPSKAEKLL